MKGTLTLLAALAATWLASPAQAQDDADHWYLSASGSVSLLDDARMDVIGLPTPAGHVETVHKFDTGYGVQAAVGRRVGSFRIEAEAGYSDNHADNTSPLCRQPVVSCKMAIKMPSGSWRTLTSISAMGRFSPSSEGGLVGRRFTSSLPLRARHFQPKRRVGSSIRALARLPGRQWRARQLGLITACRSSHNTAGTARPTSRALTSAALH